MGILDSIGGALKGTADFITGGSDHQRKEAATARWTSVPVDSDGDGVTDDPSAPLYSQEVSPGESTSFGPKWTQYDGTSYSKVRTDDPNFVDTNPGGSGADDMRNRIGGNGDIRNYQYGRSATGADDAVNRATQIGTMGLGRAVQTDALDRANSDAAGNRSAIAGNWGQQNAALGGATSYAGQLGALENTEGPSAAQAQLQSGTNQAMAQQMAMARSGRGMGGNAAAMGLAQGNMAGISANQANQAANLRAQENAAWRGRQATNLGNAAGIRMGAASQYGQQGQADLGAAVQGRAQNDQAALAWAAQGDTAYNNGQTSMFNGLNLANNIRQTELGAGATAEDNSMRNWAARNNYTLAQQQRADQQEAAMLQFAATTGASLLGD